LQQLLFALTRRAIRVNPNAADLIRISAQRQSARPPTKHATAWCAAWNSRDLDAIMTHYAEDVEFSSPTVVTRWGHADGWLHGKAKLRENFAIGIKAPSLYFELVDVLLGVDAICVIYRRETGALVSDLVEIDEHGHGRRVFACYGRPPAQA
jgi:hypothetical protein